MQARPDKSFLYITPFLTECQRIQNSTAPEREFILPSNEWPKISKLTDIKELLNAQEDIAASHELFKRFDEEARGIIAFNSNKYILIIDEILDVVAPTTLKPKDISILIDSNTISIDENNVCHWNPAADSDCRYEDVYQLATSNNLVCVKNQFFLWRYDPEIFDLFDEIYIMTYLFDGSIMKGYFDYYGIPYEKKTLCAGSLVDYAPEDTSRFRDLINIYDGPLNDGFSKSSMSKSWYESRANADKIVQLRRNMDNYFKNKVNSRAGTRLWSTFKIAYDEMVTSRYRKEFTSLNTCHVDDYEQRCNLAYMANIYIHPIVPHFFADSDIKLDRDQYALSRMLRWMWCSRIRDNQSINCYIPSKRMRNLLTNWINNSNKGNTHCVLRGNSSR